MDEANVLKKTEQRIGGVKYEVVWLRCSSRQKFDLVAYSSLGGIMCLREQKTGEYTCYACVPEAAFRALLRSHDVGNYYRCYIKDHKKYIAVEPKGIVTGLNWEEKDLDEITQDAINENGMEETKNAGGRTHFIGMVFECIEECIARIVVAFFFGAILFGCGKALVHAVMQVNEKVTASEKSAITEANYSSSSYTEMEMCSIAQKYYNRKNDDISVTARITKTGETCQISLYDNQENLVDRYEVNAFSLIGEDMTGEKMDLKDADKPETYPRAISNSNSESTNDQIIPHASTSSYIINKKSKKIHYFTCGTAYNSWKNKPEQFMETDKDLSTLISLGYDTCGNCF